jgi:hypothetical protein
MDETYSDNKTKPRIGDVVMGPGTIRGIVIEVKDTFVKVLAIATRKETGDTFVLPQRFVHDVPVADCMYMEPQRLNFY